MAELAPSEGRVSPTTTALRKSSSASQANSNGNSNGNGNNNSTTTTTSSPVPTSNTTGGPKQTNFKRPHLPSHVTDFNIEKTKFRVFKAIEDKAPPKFRTFFKSSLMDRFLQATLLYFISRFQHQMVSRRKEIYGDQKDDSMFATNGRSLDKLKEETEQYMEELAAAYAQIILTQSDYRHTQHDKFFFEALYESTHQILVDAFAGHRRGNELEIELGRIFRSETFNLSKRKHSTRYTTENLSVREIYKLKHEGNYALNYKLLQSLHQRKRQSGANQLGVDQCSPAINLLLAKRGDPKRADVSPVPMMNNKTNGNASSKMNDDSTHGGSSNTIKGSGEAKEQQQNKTNNTTSSQDGGGKDMEAFPVASSIEYLETVKVALLLRGSHDVSTGRERGDSVLNQ